MTPWAPHQPVLVHTVIELLRVIPAGVVIDGTVGGGGHASALLDVRPDLLLLGIDRDEDAVAAARQALARFGPRAVVVHAGFEELDAVADRLRSGPDGIECAEEFGDAPVTAVLLDLGVSSHQLDRAERGFSYRADAPLDMRMDRSQPRTAADLVNDTDPAELARIISAYGDERFARSIARRIVARRPIETTGALVDVIKDAIPAPARRRGGHPARRTFQALRMEVNQELAHLDRGLDAAIDTLAPRGRLVVLSYHSLEDRMVKHRFAERAGRGASRSGPAGLPVPPTGPAPVIDIVTRRAIRASAQEIGDNRRSESVRLRAVEKLAPNWSGDVSPEPPGGHAA